MLQQSTLACFRPHQTVIDYPMLAKITWSKLLPIYIINLRYLLKEIEIFKVMQN